MSYNIILDQDFYKLGHYKLYDPNIVYSSSYIEPRVKNIVIIPFGYRNFLEKFSTPITQEMIDKAEMLLKHSGLPFNKEDWQYILDKHNGYLPIHIQAVDEGTPIESQNALIQVINTDPKLAWLSSYIETMALRCIWYPTTVATLSYNLKQLFKQYKEKTSDNDFTGYMLNDFGSRGVSSEESGKLGGAAHLLSFDGSDNMSAVEYIYDMYGYVCQYPSVLASEHSTTTSWGKDNEFHAVGKWLTENPDRILSVVIDSYNDLEFINQICTTFKSLVEKRTQPLVLRPDSKIPVEILCGKEIIYFNELNCTLEHTLYELCDFGQETYYYSNIDNCYYKSWFENNYFTYSKVTDTLELIEIKGVIRYLMDSFGFITNSKGYKVLPDYIRVIQGDGVNPTSIKQILDKMVELKLSCDNVIFGMGGKLLQGVDRDTYGFACKCSHVILNDGTTRDVFKDPIGAKSKKSKKGRLVVVNRNGKHETIRVEEMLPEEVNLLKTIHHNGKIYKENIKSFKEMKENL